MTASTPPRELDYRIAGDAIVSERLLEDGRHVIGYHAENIRPERTGVHARVSITLQSAALAWSVINIERDEDRVRLSNSAYGHIELNGVGALLPKSYLKHELDLFCSGLWSAKVGSDLAIPVPGLLTAQPPKRLAGSFLIDGGGTIFFGPPERGKSWATMTMAVCIDAGLQTLWPVVQRPVLFINLERSQGSVANRLGAINRALGLPADRPLTMMNRRGYSLTDIYAAAERSIAALGSQDCAVFLDSISRAGAGNLNDNEPANRIMDLMNRLAPSWAGICHTPRADATHIFGSHFFEAGADITVKVLTETRGSTMGVGMIRDKANDLPKMLKPEVTAFEFGPHEEDGLIGIRRAKLAEFPELLLEGKQDSRGERIARFLGMTGESTIAQIAEGASVDRASVIKLVTESNQFVRAGKDGRDVLYGLAPSWLNQPADVPGF